MTSYTTSEVFAEESNDEEFVSVDIHDDGYVVPRQNDFTKNQNNKEDHLALQASSLFPNASIIEKAVTRNDFPYYLIYVGIFISFTLSFLTGTLLHLIVWYIYRRHEEEKTRYYSKIHLMLVFINMGLGTCLLILAILSPGITASLSLLICLFPLIFCIPFAFTFIIILFVVVCICVSTNNSPSPDIG